MASANTIAVIASPSTDSDWYIDALQNSCASVQRYSKNSIISELQALSCLPRDSLLLVTEPVADDFYSSLETVLTRWGRNHVQVIAASVSEKSVFVAGPDHTVNAWLPLLQSPGIPVHRVSENFSSAAKLRLVHDHLLGVHVVAATEAMGLAAKAGLNTNQVYDIIVSAAGNSTAFETRAKKMLAADQTPVSTLTQTTDKLASPRHLSYLRA